MSDPIASIGNYLAYDYLSVNGIVVATEGDVCREISICEPTWSKQGLKNACDIINEMDTLRQSVRRLVGAWRKEVESLSGITDYSEGMADAVKECADELSALIDGKEER